MSHIKREFAEQLVSQSSPDGGLGRTMTTILVDDRNKAAMRVFQKQLAQGKKRIGISFGAAHMPDFERRLVLDFGLKKQSTTWSTAWDLRDGEETAIDRVLQTLFQAATRDLKRATRQPEAKAPVKPRRRIL